MRIIFLLIVLVAISFTNAFSQHDPSKIAGAYQWCPFPCGTFKINSDFTFNYNVNGDLFNNETTEGRWSFVGKDRIHLRSIDGNLISKASEESIKPKNGISVLVTDLAGGIFAGIVIRIFEDGKPRQYITNEDGVCEIPKTRSIEVEFTTYKETYQFKNLDVSSLHITIGHLAPTVDDTFVVKKNELCKIDEGDKTFENCFAKISQKRTRRIFPIK